MVTPTTSRNDSLKATQYGLIAQEVQKVFPEMVSTVDEEGHIGVSYEQMIPVLVEALLEQQEQIEAQPASIEALEKQNATLTEMKSELAAIKALLQSNSSSGLSTAGEE